MPKSTCVKSIRRLYCMMTDLQQLIDVPPRKVVRALHKSTLMKPYFLSSQLVLTCTKRVPTPPLQSLDVMYWLTAVSKVSANKMSAPWLALVDQLEAVWYTPC